MASSTDIGPEHNGAPLTTTQIVVLVANGVVLWFLAALLIRAIEPLGAFDGLGRLVVYALVIPGSLPFVYLLRAVAKLRRDRTAIGVTIATAAALLLDGIAVALVPSLYGADPAGAGAAILWGAGVALVLGVAMNR